MRYLSPANCGLRHQNVSERPTREWKTVKYRVECYTSSGHTFYRLISPEKRVHLGRAKTPEERLTDIGLKLKKLYESNDHAKLIETLAALEELEVYILQEWREPLKEWHDSVIPSTEDVMALHRSTTPRRKAVLPHMHKELLPFDPSQAAVDPTYKGEAGRYTITKSEQPLHYDYETYEQYWKGWGDFMAFWEFVGDLREREELEKEVAKARAVFEEKEGKLRAKMHEIEPFLHSPTKTGKREISP